ncbi:MAG: trypsin-like peptidase domain-containing protein [Ruminococcus sp.]|nr:trypsin-like peptidase domain-containing protein [Ruminococcus sp.]
MNNDYLNPSEDNITENTTPEAPTQTNSTDFTEQAVEFTEAVKDTAEEITEASVCDTATETSQEAFAETLTDATPADSPANVPVYTNPEPVRYYNQPANTQPVYQAPYQAPYQSPAKPSAPEAPKKKKGHVAFLVCLFSIIGVFAISFFVLCGYVAGQHAGSSGSTRPTLFEEFDKNEETEPASEKEETPEGVIPLPDKDKDEYSSQGSIDLKELPRDKNNTDKYTTQYAYKKVAESTIGVICYDKGFTGEPASQGTGIVITEDGYIATNSHVIGDSRSAYNVQVVTNDGTTYEAKVVGYDSRTDLAVLKVNAKNLTPAEFCDSNLVEVGVDVIAVGNPGGMDFQNSLTRGVVSALNRELGLSAQVTYIQTDAAINPGNSGGPLSNMYGQVIGITTAKISSESVEGMGFAIPSQTVKEIVDDLMTQGYVSNRVRLGISGQAVSSAMQQYYDLPKGILVGEISEGGPCDNTELKVNDVITKIDDEEIDDFSDVYAILAKHNPNDKVVLTVYRNDTGKTLEVTITLMADEGQTQQ